MKDLNKTEYWVIESMESPVNYWKFHTYPGHLSYEFQAISTWVLTSSSIIQYKDSDTKSVVYATTFKLFKNPQKKSPKIIFQHFSCNEINS